MIEANLGVEAETCCAGASSLMKDLGVTGYCSAASFAQVPFLSNAILYLCI